MEQKLSINPEVSMQAMCGKFDENVKIIQDQFGVEIFFIGSELLLKGSNESIGLAIKVLRAMENLILAGSDLDLQKLEYLIHMTLSQEQHNLEELDKQVLIATHKGKLIKPRTKGQDLYCKTIEENTLTFGVGPAGTGKTFLAVTMAARAFRNKEEIGRASCRERV